MPIAAPTAQLPQDASDDIEYVRSSFRPMEDAVRPLVEQGVLPQASYVLPDGTPMVPADHVRRSFLEGSPDHDDARGLREPVAVAVHLGTPHCPRASEPVRA